MVAPKFVERRSTAVAETRESRDLLTSVDRSQVPTAELERLDRIVGVLQELDTRLTVADIRFVVRDTIDDLSNLVTGVRDEVREFVILDGEVSLDHTNDSMERILIRLGELPPVPWRSTQQAATKVADAFKDQVDQLNDQISILSSRFEERVVELSSALQNELRERAESAQSTEEKIKNEIDKLFNVAEGIERQLSGLSEQAANYNSTLEKRYGATEGVRQSTFETDQLNRRNSFVEEIDHLKSEYENTIKDQRSEGEELVEFLTKTKTDAESILAITAAAGMADTYLKDAEEQKSKADRWRIIVIIGGLLALVGGITTLVQLAPPVGATVMETAFFYTSRTAILLVPFALVVFLIRAEAQHRNREQESKRLGKELTTLRPFLAELPEDQRNDKIKEATERYFPGHNRPGMTPPTE